MTENTANETIENLEEFNIATFCTNCGKECDLETYSFYDGEFDIVSKCCGDIYVREDD